MCAAISIRSAARSFSCSAGARRLPTARPFKNSSSTSRARRRRSPPTVTTSRSASRRSSSGSCRKSLSNDTRPRHNSWLIWLRSPAHSASTSMSKGRGAPIWSCRGPRVHPGPGSCRWWRCWPRSPGCGGCRRSASGDSRRPPRWRSMGALVKPGIPPAIGWRPHGGSGGSSTARRASEMLPRLPQRLGWRKTAMSSSAPSVASGTRSPVSWWAGG